MVMTAPIARSWPIYRVRVERRLHRIDSAGSSGTLRAMVRDATDILHEEPDREKRPILRNALPPDDWAVLLQRGRSVSFRKGDVILERGTPGDCMYIVREGRVEISLVLAEGQKAVLNHMGPGEVLGELAVLDGGLRSADAIAASADVHLISVPRAQVLAILEASSNVTTALIHELCALVRNASDMFEVKSEKNAPVRLARTLLQLAAKWGRGDGTETTIPSFSQGELGDFAGLARENVNRQLKRWEDQGLIRRSAEGIILLDTDAIAEMAQL